MQTTIYTSDRTQANSTQLIVILYEMTLQYLADGEQAADDAGLAEAVHRARGCIKELLNSLHREYSPAGELSRLYLFCLRRLAVCEVRRDRTILEEIRKVIAPLCDAYRQIQDRGYFRPGDEQFSDSICRTDLRQEPVNRKHG